MFRCGPCQRIAPVFQQLSTKFPNAVFLKVDVDKCAETAASQNVSSMPTFIFYRNRTKIDRCEGANATVLEAKIVEHYGSNGGAGGDDDTEAVAGHVRNTNNLYYNIIGMIILALFLYYYRHNSNNDYNYNL